VLRISRANGEVLIGLRIEGVRLTCNATNEGRIVVCSAPRMAVGTYVITVAAEGEDPVELTVSILPDHGCCSCGTVPVLREVVLGASIEEDASTEDGDAGAPDADGDGSKRDAGG
jgi:hypothetical protein